MGRVNSEAAALLVAGYLPREVLGIPRGNRTVVKDRNRAAHCSPYREGTEEAQK